MLDGQLSRLFVQLLLERNIRYQVSLWRWIVCLWSGSQPSHRRDPLVQEETSFGAFPYSHGRHQHQQGVVLSPSRYRHIREELQPSLQPCWMLHLPIPGRWDYSYTLSLPSSNHYSFALLLPVNHNCLGLAASRPGPDLPLQHIDISVRKQSSVKLMLSKGISPLWSGRQSDRFGCNDTVLYRYPDCSIADLLLCRSYLLMCLSLFKVSDWLYNVVSNKSFRSWTKQRHCNSK